MEVEYLLISKYLNLESIIIAVSISSVGFSGSQQTHPDEAETPERWRRCVRRDVILHQLWTRDTRSILLLRELVENPMSASEYLPRFGTGLVITACLSEWFLSDRWTRV